MDYSAWGTIAILVAVIALGVILYVKKKNRMMRTLCVIWTIPAICTLYFFIKGSFFLNTADAQVAFGKFTSISQISFWIMVILGLIPFLIWLLVSLILLFWRKSASLKWWGIIVGVLCIYGIVANGFSDRFIGPYFRVAEQLDVFVPPSARILEDDRKQSRDQNEKYIVIQFNQSQMDDFIVSVKAKGWEYGRVVPNTIRPPNSNSSQDPMSGRKYPFPKTEQGGYYYSFIERIDGKGDYHTLRKAYFLDVESKILYFYYDYAQWG